MGKSDHDQTRKKIVIAYPYVPESAIFGVVRVLRSRFVGQGPLVDKFEREFEKVFHLAEGTAVAVNSGTSALELAYDLLGLGKGDEVITTPLTCTATNIPLLRRGATPVFADVLKETLNLDPGSVRKLITPKTKAIVNVHLHGNISDLPDFGVPVVDDSAQALGPVRPGATFTAFSFQAIKHITTGDGGMLVCHRPSDAHEAKLRRWFGIDRALKLKNNWQPFQRRKILFDIRSPGFKFQMTDIAAALGLAGLSEYPFILDHRRQIFQIYRDAGLPLIDSSSNRYGFACLLVPYRDEFCSILLKKGIETNVMQVRNDLYEIFQPFKRSLPNLDWIEPRYICIPLHNHLTLEDARYISQSTVEALETISNDRSLLSI